MAIMEHVNGRAVPALPTHTFKDSGITIRIRKIGPMTQQRLSQAIQRELPEPPPPVIDTELGIEQNAADPAYVTARAKWQQDAAIELNNRMLKLAALEADVTLNDTAYAQIARTRRNMQLSGIGYTDDPQLDSDENERVFYILYVACASTDDLREFGAAVTQRSTPTEEAVQRHITTFPGNLPPA